MREIVLRREVFPIVEQHRALADVARRRSSAVSSSHPGDPGEKGRKGSWGPAYIKGGRKRRDERQASRRPQGGEPENPQRTALPSPAPPRGAGTDRGDYLPTRDAGPTLGARPLEVGLPRR